MLKPSNSDGEASAVISHHSLLIPICKPAMMVHDVSQAGRDRKAQPAMIGICLMVHLR